MSNYIIFTLFWIDILFILVDTSSKHKSTKGCNPLDPRYIWSTKSGRRQIIGEIDQNKPKIYSIPSRNKDTRRMLRTDDIEGAQPFYKRSKGVKMPPLNHQTIELLKSEGSVPITKREGLSNGFC
jgi:hypothetical protein